MAASIVSEVVSRLAGLLSQEIIFLHGVRDEVEWMERELRWIKCFLKDADAKRKKGDERVRNWVSEVIQVAYQAEDAIDTFLIKVHHESGGSCISCINSFRSSSVKARHYVGVEIGKIKERVNQIEASRVKYGILNLGEDGDATSSLLPVRRRHFSYQSDDADVVVGHANDQKILLQQLINHNHQKRLCVISIVGIGGLGKTTLARKLYRSNDVSSHFDKRIWVTVSQENSLMGLLKKILQQVAVIEREEKMGESDLIDKLNESLRTQRFLIVLDDIWLEDVWVQMQRSFPDVNNGSRVLITTRFLNVAKRADPRSTPHELSLLNDSESMKLFLKKAFPDQDDDAETNCPSGLLDIGHRLMRKCGGLPLALVVLGGLLSIKEKTPVVWMRMLETMDWEFEGRECREILALSYEDLPYHMKSCFLYLGAYPEDSEISGSALIKQWVAEGFIPQDSERKAMEDTGEAILEELIQRSLIHVNSRKSNGSVKTCGVHDLLLDLARSEAKKDGFLTVFSHENDQATPQTLLRRMAIHNINVTAVPFNEIHTMHGLRTSMLFGGNAFLPLQAVSGILRFELLRVLDLTGISYMSELPKKIKLPIHLRYLALPEMTMGGVPSSVGNLQFLETINAERVFSPAFSRRELVGIPITLWKIKTLRHVQVYFCEPPQNHQSRNLLTLGCVSFGSHRTINWRLPNLRKLKVLIDEKHQGAMLAHLLNQLDHLISLCIRSPEYPIEINTKDFPFHNHLMSLTLHGRWPMGDIISEFPIYLTKLELKQSCLKQDPMPKLERLQYLVTLKLGQNVYVGKTMICSAGGFPRLERLSIFEIATYLLWEWRVEEGAMPILIFLELASCRNLKMLPDLQHVTSLQELKLSEMSEQLMLSVRKETGQDWYKIQHVPKLTLQK